MKLVLIVALFVWVPELVASEDLNLVGINEFLSTWLLPEALNQNPDGNTIVSSFSLLVPIAELTLASDSNSRENLNQLLRLMNGDLDLASPIDDETILRVFSSLKEVLIEDDTGDGVTLETPSRVYLSDKQKLNKSFLKKIERVLGSSVSIKSINIKRKKPALAKMNKWVKRSTRSTIKHIISDYEADSYEAVFLNTVFFKAPWRYQFQRTSGRKGFSLNSTTNVPVHYLKLSAFLEYAECPEIDSKLLKIPYQYKKDISLIIVLPNQVKEASDLAQEPSIKTSKIIASAIQNMTTKHVNLLLPTFKARQEIELNKALQLVAPIFLSNDGTLTKVLECRKALAVYPAIQKVYYEVKEDESESATDSGSYLESDSESRTVEIGGHNKFHSIEFNVNRPFQFLLRVEEYTVFSGIVQNPQYD